MVPSEQQHDTARSRMLSCNVTVCLYAHLQRVFGSMEIHVSLKGACVLAVFVHHLPAITQQVGYNPADLEGQLPHSLASLILLSLPALLALGAHGVTHYLIRVSSHLQTHHEQIPAAQPSQDPTPSARNDTQDSATGSSSPGVLSFRSIQQQAAAVAAAAAKVGVDMAAESVQAGWSTVAAASQKLQSRIKWSSILTPGSKQLSPAMTASSRGTTNRSSMNILKDGANSLGTTGQGSSLASSTGGSGKSSTDLLEGGVSGLGLAELQPWQKVPTAAVGVAVGRSRPPQAFLQLAYGYLPLVWAGTLTHYLPAFLLQAGRILPVSLFMPLKLRDSSTWSASEAEGFIHMMCLTRSFA